MINLNNLIGAIKIAQTAVKSTIEMLPPDPNDLVALAQITEILQQLTALRRTGDELIAVLPVTRGLIQKPPSMN